MTDDRAWYEVRLRVGPYSDRAVTVYFEPAGKGFELLGGDWLDVTVRAQDHGLVEIGHTPDTVSVGVWPNADLVVRDNNGAELEL